MAHSTTMSADTAAVLDALTALTATAFDAVDQITAPLLDLLSSSGAPRRSTLVGIDAVVTEVVERVGHPAQGAGYVAAVGFLADEPWWLEWFGQGDDGRAQRVVCQTDPSGSGFYDYEFLPWYVVPRDTGRRHVTGPYVDYLCTDDYTLTFTQPVHHGDRFAGVTGVDVGVGTAEKLLLPSLRAAGQRLVVVNEHGRIVASNSGRHVCGDLVTEVDLPKVWPAAATPAAVPGLHVLDGLPLGVLELATRR
ncbi:cache domain-containing protein [Nocardioides stalactiti]|uniref:cache domain-containing protein n=1 Tax=Nocardioides stalactiti TaxID=2755356 RepID=UPI0015FEFF51|nr:cache domain-containing protein [Nocardioides stalactiti]